jgi:hypothetical protein
MAAGAAPPAAGVVAGAPLAALEGSGTPTAVVEAAVEDMGAPSDRGGIDAPAAPTQAVEAAVPEEASTKLRSKVAALWAAVPKNEQGAIERLACWDILLADEELARLVDKNGDGAKL